MPFPKTHHGSGPSPRSISDITPNLFLGDLYASPSVATLVRYSITAMVSLALERAPEWTLPAHRKLILPSITFFVECDDSLAQDLLGRLGAIYDFIDRQTAQPDLEAILRAEEDEERSLTSMSSGRSGASSGISGILQPGRVLVHCTVDVSRSATVVVAYLMRAQRRSLRSVLSNVKKRRRAVWLNDNFMAKLGIWEKVWYEVWKMEGGKKMLKEEYQRFSDRRGRVPSRQLIDVGMLFD